MKRDRIQKLDVILNEVYINERDKKKRVDGKIKKKERKEELVVLRIGRTMSHVKRKGLNK